MEITKEEAHLLSSGGGNTSLKKIEENVSRNDTELSEGSKIGQIISIEFSDKKDCQLTASCSSVNKRSSNKPKSQTGSIKRTLPPATLSVTISDALRKHYGNSASLINSGTEGVNIVNENENESRIRYPDPRLVHRLSELTVSAAAICG